MPPASRTSTDGPSDWISARDALEMATVGSARCLGWDDRLGAIRVGMAADLAFVDQSGPAWHPRNLHAVQLVNGAGQGAVTDVMVGGDFVVRDRRLSSIDVDRVLDHAQRAADRVFSETAGLRKKAEAITPAVVAHIARINSRYAGAARLIEHAHATGRR